MAINWKKNYANQIPENAATFEHLIDRNQENRKMYRAIKGQQCVVLACYKCNHERGTVRNKQRQMSEKNEAKRANARPQ
jgi:sulfur relay (sulfurtransferase) complex TusBCD TusD component (DsrE family)